MPLDGASPRVTLGIATYNRHDYLAEAIRSALDQDFTDLEVLVSRFVRPTNSVRNSRMTAQDIEALSARCDRERDEAQAQLDTPGRMTIVLSDTPMEAQLRADLAQRSGCTKLSSATVCVGR